MTGTPRWWDSKKHSNFPHIVMLAGALIALSQSQLSLGSSVSFLQEGFRVRAEQDPWWRHLCSLCYKSPGPTARPRWDYQTQTCWWETSSFSRAPVNPEDTEKVTPETWHTNPCGQMMEEWWGEEGAPFLGLVRERAAQSGKPAPQADGGAHGWSQTQGRRGPES